VLLALAACGGGGGGSGGGGGGEVLGGVTTPVEVSGPELPPPPPHAASASRTHAALTRTYGFMITPNSTAGKLERDHAAIATRARRLGVRPLASSPLRVWRRAWAWRVGLRRCRWLWRGIRRA
ncbi:MAG: hypothetical protein EOP61_23535, partial [Sphingomonadales bacterium]